MKPSPGRIVHYYKFWLMERLEEEPQVAIILKVVDSERVILRVFSLNGAEDDLTLEAKFSSEPKTGCWTWPPRDQETPVQEGVHHPETTEPKDPSAPGPDSSEEILAPGLRTIESAAAALGCSSATVRRLIARGSLRVRSALGRVAVLERDVERERARRDRERARRDRRRAGAPKV